MRGMAWATALIGGALVGACSDRREVGGDIDLNAAAALAQADIANYAAARPAARRLAAGRFRCADGGIVAVRLDRGAGVALVSIDGVAQPPLGRRIGTGVYQGGGVMLRGGGPALTLDRPGRPPLACTATD